MWRMMHEEAWCKSCNLPGGIFTQNVNMNAGHYVHILRLFHCAVQRRLPQLMRDNAQFNASTHWARISHNFLHQTRTAVMEHPPHSPPCDFFLFPSLEKHRPMGLMWLALIILYYPLNHKILFHRDSNKILPAAQCYTKLFFAKYEHNWAPYSLKKYCPQNIVHDAFCALHTLQWVAMVQITKKPGFVHKEKWCAGSLPYGKLALNGALTPPFPFKVGFLLYGRCEARQWGGSAWKIWMTLVRWLFNSSPDRTEDL